MSTKISPGARRHLLAVAASLANRQQHPLVISFVSAAQARKATEFLRAIHRRSNRVAVLPREVTP